MEKNYDKIIPQKLMKLPKKELINIGKTITGSKLKQNDNKKNIVQQILEKIMLSPNSDEKIRNLNEILNR